MITDNKCSWALAKPIDEYHDNEHGKMPCDNKQLFELLVLEIFQPGLSFNIVLKKRQGLRDYFHDYDLDAIAKMNESDIIRGLENQQIIRHRLKIESVIANSKLCQNLDLKQYIYDNIDYRFGIDMTGKLLSKQMKKDGFRFVGPSVVTSLLEAIGLLPAHFDDCIYNTSMDRSLILETPIMPLLITHHNFSITSSKFISDTQIISQTNLSSFETLIKYQVENYFQNQVENFKFHLSLKGTQFQKQVWDFVRTINFGQTMTYGDVGFSIGSGAARAVGSALKKTQFALFIPAQRVVASSGIGGFQNQLELKYQLLAHEGITIYE